MADAVQLLADLVKNTRELAQAVQDGREYFVRQHPEAKASLVQMLTEMQTTVEGLARVTSVVTGFRFTTDGAARDFEPSRFNTYVISQSEKVAKLRGDLRKLKGSCSNIRDARDKLNDLAGGQGDWAAMFRLFGKSRRARDNELARALSNFYADDRRMIEAIEKILKLSETALEEANAALGPPGHASTYNAEKAAAVLNVYGLVFNDSGKQLDALVKTLEDTADKLT
ncbi:MAG TPA: hypothetical protein VIZ66_02855 [Sphingomicrobium sp.]